MESRAFRSEKFSEPLTDIETLQQLHNDEDVLYLDVRTPEEVEEGTVENAVCIPHNELKHRLSEIEEYKDRPIVTFCKVGGRSDFALQVLKMNGFNRVYNAGGYEEVKEYLNC